MVRQLRFSHLQVHEKYIIFIRTLLCYYRHMKQVQQSEAENICVPQFSLVTSGHAEVTLKTSRLRVIKYGRLKDAMSVVNLYVLPHKQQSLANSRQR